MPVNIKGHTLWAFLDTGSGRNFISRDAVRKLKLEPAHHETREVLTINGYKTTHMPIYQTSIDSLDGNVRERVQLTGLTS